MIITAEMYEKMKQIVHEAINNNVSVTVFDADSLGVDFDALSSLYSQLFVRNLKVELKKLNYHKVQEIIRRVQEGESLLEISREHRIGTLKFAKIYLEATKGKSFQMSSILDNPNVIEDPKIRDDVLRMMELDPSCSHEVEQLKECVGREYEKMLEKMLTQRHMCFETEVELRARGKPKTPDILFLIPMGALREAIDYQGEDVHNDELRSPTPRFRKSSMASTTSDQEFDESYYLGKKDDTYGDSALDDSMVDSDMGDGVEMNGDNMNNSNHAKKHGTHTGYFVINWIDSKAMFADMQTFTENLDQFRAYNNRYGRGLVIYWHGFVEEISTHLQGEDDRIIVRDHLPEHWIFPTGEKANGKPPSFDSIELDLDILPKTNYHIDPFNFKITEQNEDEDEDDDSNKNIPLIVNNRKPFSNTKKEGNDSDPDLSINLPENASITQVGAELIKMVFKDAELDSNGDNS